MSIDAHGFTYRRLPALSPGQRYPDWVQRLQGRNGVYLIRPIWADEPCYVGESLFGRLKKTMLRHFQHWEGRGSGPSYDRQEFEVAVLVLCAACTSTVERALIKHFSPADNRWDGRCIVAGRRKVK